MMEITICGRGGQGGVTLAKIIASAYFLKGKYVQAFGVYAAERSGAPLQAFVRGLVTPQADRLGWFPDPGEDDLTRELRGLMLRARGGLGDDQSTVAEARGVLEEVLASPDTVDGEVASAALAIVAAHGDEQDFARFVELVADGVAPRLGHRNRPVDAEDAREIESLCEKLDQAMANDDAAAVASLCVELDDILFYVQ